MGSKAPFQSEPGKAGLPKTSARLSRATAVAASPHTHVHTTTYDHPAPHRVRLR